jgi:glycosyltransferase involved in cell wall biosynthesis
MPRILFLCGREAAYPLNRFLIDCARSFAVVDVIAEGGSGRSIVRRSGRVILEAVPRMLSGRYDLVVVGFFGHFLMPLVRLFARSPVLFHPLISAYETLVFDRRKYAPGSIPARMALRLDRMACRAADHLLLDTHANIEHFSRAFEIPPSRFTRLFVGSDEKFFHPRPGMVGKGQTVVLFYGTFLPLHGIDVIVEAARRLAHRPDIVFRLIGRGIEFERISGMVAQLGLTNLEFRDPVPLEELPDLIAAADICLGGHFGGSEKARRVISGKTFHDLAMGKPTIVGDNDANRELLTHGEDAWFVEPENPDKLAEAIVRLAGDPDLRDRIGAAAARTFSENASLRVLSTQLREVVDRLLKK